MADQAQRAIAISIGVPVARRHIFLCCDQTKPKCCDKDRGLAAWDFLKGRLKELGLSEQGGILRTKANCLRICEGGPIAVVYPEGAWYGAVRSAGARADHPGTSHRRPCRRRRVDRAKSVGGPEGPPYVLAALKGCATFSTAARQYQPTLRQGRPSKAPIRGDLHGYTVSGHPLRAGANCAARPASPSPPCSRWRSASARRRRSSASSIGWCCGRCRIPIPIG